MSPKKKKIAGMRKRTKRCHFLKKTPLPVKPDLDVYLNLGVIHSNQGNYEEAATCFQRVLSIDPECPTAHYNLGSVFQEQGKRAEAIVCFKRALSINHNYLEAHYNSGVVFLKQDRYEEAATCFKKALSIKPDLLEAILNQGVVCTKQGKYEEAVAYLQRVLSIKPNHPAASLNLGILLSEQNKYEEAAACLEGVLSLNPEFHEAHRQLGSIQKGQGRLKEAMISFQKALSIKPDYALTHFEMSSLQKYSGSEAHISEMEQLFSRHECNDEQKMYLAFGLAKAYEDSGIYKKSFHYLEEGNRLKRNTFTYSIEEAEDEFKRIKSTFTKSFIINNSKYGNPDSTPIFILGMPRSGTSLVEQILASHPNVYGAGELAYFSQTISQLSLADSINQTCKNISKNSEEIITSLGRDYIQKIRKSSTEAEFITDKMPNNFLWIGAICLALPNAKIICCSRDSMDNCLSIYKNIFHGNHKYAYDLEELGHYHLHYLDLMRYWHDVFPGKIHDINYEKLVGNQEVETRRLLKHCRLSWDKACLSFHKTSRTVATASAVQVRKPIYKDSVQLWKRYEKQLQPLSRILSDKDI